MAPLCSQMGPLLNWSQGGRRNGVGPPRLHSPIKIQSLLLSFLAESDTAGCLRSYLPAYAAGLKPAERGPGGSLTETYCTQLGMIPKNEPLPEKMFIIMVKMGLLGASWGPLGSLLGAKLGPSWGQVAIWRRLGAILEATWRQLGRRWRRR